MATFHLYLVSLSTPSESGMKFMDVYCTEKATKVKMMKAFYLVTRKASGL